MNNAKLWLVVHPTVGVPLFLGAVAVGSFAVHVAVLSNTSWVSDFLSGRPLGSGSAQSAALAAPDAVLGSAAHVVPGQGREVTVILSDGTVARAILQAPEKMASMTAVRPLNTN